MSKFKRVLCMVVTVIMIAGIMAACGGANTAGEANTVTASTAAETKAPATETKAPAKEVNLVLYTEQVEGSIEGDSIRSLVKKYEDANPGIKIEVRSATSQDFDKFFKTAVSGNEKIDIVQNNVQFHRDYVQKKLLLDITDKIDMNKIKRVDAAWNQMKYFSMDGKIYGIPIKMDTCAIYYNKEVFKKFNLEIPKTWDDIYKMREPLKNGGVYPLVYAGAEPWWNPMHFNMIFYQMTGNQGIATNDKFMAGDFSDAVLKPYVDTLQFLADLEKNKVFISGTQGMDSPAATNAFAQGKAAMYFMGNWYIDNLKQSAPNLDYGVFPVPLIKDGVKSEAPGSIANIWSIYSKSENADAAYKFLEYYTTGDAAVGYYKINQSAVNILPDLNYKNPLPVMEDFNKIAPSTVIWLDAIWEPEIIKDFQMGCQEAILAKKTPKQVMDGIVADYKKLREQGKTFIK